MTSTSGAKVMRPDHVGCTGGILRRLLCTGLRFRGLDGGGGGVCGGVDGRGVMEEEGGAAAPAPGVIARLMGLDTMPPAEEETRGKVGVRCGTGRSRSMSRIESSSCWTPATDEASSTRLKKSSSLRETPTFLRPENEDFLLLSFGHDDEEGEEVSATMIEFCLLKLEEKEKHGRRAKKNSTKTADKRLIKKIVEKEPRTPDSETSSQVSSPVSVLDRDLDSTADRFIDAQEIPVSGYHSSSTDHRRRDSQGTRCTSSATAEPDEDPSQQNSRRRRSRARELQIVVRNPTPDVHHHPSASEKVHGIAVTAATATPAPRGTGSPELWFNIRRLTGEDLRRTDWVAHGAWRETRFTEDVGAGVELQVLDLLLRELVEDLHRKR